MSIPVVFFDVAGRTPMPRRLRKPGHTLRRLLGLARDCTVTAVLITAGPDVSAETSPISALDAPARTAAFVQRLDVLRRQAGIPGLSVAVVENGEVVLAAGLGFADLEQGIPATADTPYDIASVTKPLSAVVALRLVEEGALDLDRPMVEYSAWADFCREFSEQPSIFARDLHCEAPAHSLRHLLNHTATGRPGARFSYNPILYSWASRPIMAATDTPFSALVAEHVFAPAGMDQSARKHRALPLRADLAARLAQHYAIDAAGRPVPGGPRSPQGDGAAGGVVSTVLDLARFDVAFDGGTLVSPASRTRMLSPARGPEGAAMPYGLGWFVQEHEGRRLLWHSGWWEDAWSALYLKLPDERLTLILLANSEGIWWGNALGRAEVERSPFARAFLEAFATDRRDD